MTSGRTLLRKSLLGGPCVAAVGVHDGLTARLADIVGFEAVYVGSFAAEAAFAGRPDVGQMTRDQRLHIIEGIVDATSLPLVADMDEGFGGPSEAARTLSLFEQAGVSAVHIDDQQFPATCPWFRDVPRRPLLDVQQMKEKLAAILEARRSDETLVFARADVVAEMGVDRFDREDGRFEVVRRSNEYGAAGIDGIFVMARTIEELEFYRQEISYPLMGVFAPIEPLAVKEFDRAGFDIVIGSIVSVLAVARAVKQVYATLLSTGDWNAIAEDVATSAEFEDVTRLVEFEARALEGVGR